MPPQVDPPVIADIDAIAALLETDVRDEALRKRLCDRTLRITRYLKANLGDLQISDEKLLDISVQVIAVYL